MKIELVGGSKCGEIVNVKYLDAIVNVRDWEGREIAYSRRDRPFTLSQKFGAIFGQNGCRMYDHVKTEE